MTLTSKADFNSDYTEKSEEGGEIIFFFVKRGGENPRLVQRQKTSGEKKNGKWDEHERERQQSETARCNAQLIKWQFVVIHWQTNTAITAGFIQCR